MKNPDSLLKILIHSNESLSKPSIVRHFYMSTLFSQSFFFCHMVDDLKLELL